MEFHGVIRSDAMQMTTHMTMILPNDPSNCRATLLLLHGLSGACEDWMSKTSIARYAQKYNLAVFMPEVQRSWYTDMKNGLKYFEYVSTELPAWIARSFRVPCDREHFIIGGLSMGGYGAMKCALTFPKRFGACIALSARHYIDLKLESVLGDPRALAEYRGIFGEGLDIPEESKLPYLVENCASPRPRFYLACGTEDFLYPESVAMHALLQEKGYDVKYEEWPGIHSWDFWDEAIQKALRHFFD